VQKRRNRRKIARFLRRRERDLIYLGARALLTLARWAPRRAGLALFGRIAQVVAALAPADRRTARDNLTTVFGDSWSADCIRRFVWRVYRELGRNAFDTFYLARCSKKKFDRLVRHNSIERFREAFDEGKGVIVITAHLGCFESLLHFFPIKGFSSFAVGRRLFDRRIDRLVTGLRSGKDIEYLYRDESPRAIIELLKRGRVMGVLIDQDTSVDGVFAHFLGKPAHTPSGPVRLAMRYGIPVFVATTARRDDNTHYVSISERLPLDDTGDHERDLVKNVEKANAVISGAIRQNPEQWVWMHRRWRKQPSDPRYKDIPNIESYETRR
jgi:KDO2-lipid IV(A) lauroyltransferase